MIKYITKERLLIAISFIMVLFILSHISTCYYNRDYNNQKATIDSLLLSNQKIDSILNKANQKITIQTAIVIDNQETIKSLSDSIFNLKNKSIRKSDKILAHISDYSSITVKDKFIPYKDTIAFKKFSDSITKKCSDVIDYYKNNTITVPRVALDSSNNFKLSATINKNGLKIDSLYIPDSIYTRIVEHKGGLLKRDSKGKRHFFLKRSIEIQTFHTNNLIVTNKLNSIVYKPKKNSTFTKNVVVAVAASILTIKLLK